MDYNIGFDGVYHHQHTGQPSLQHGNHPPPLDINDPYSFGITPDTFTEPHFQIPSFLDAPPQGSENLAQFMANSPYQRESRWDDYPLKPQANAVLQQTDPGQVGYVPQSSSYPPERSHGFPSLSGYFSQPQTQTPLASFLSPSFLSNQGFMAENNSQRTSEPGHSHTAESPSTSQKIPSPIRRGSLGPAVGLPVSPAIYSESGFDMIGVLGRVASRPNPQVTIGPVDFTCSFVVADARDPEEPIVYASPTFSELTGYALEEILGKNCRFLQSPTGMVRKGETRRFTDDKAVTHIRKSLDAWTECQVSFINYRKNSESFINLVTIIPIKWDGDDFRYLVGFQVDLERQPKAILRMMHDGSYSVNYSMVHGSEKRAPGAGGHPPVSDRLRKILGRGTKSSSSLSPDQEHQMLNTMILENSDDFIHVLSLKGSIQYVSPSVKHVLEYSPEELFGKMISDIVHPSDVVPVMRELKEASVGQQPLSILSSRLLAKHYFQQAKLVHLLFRIRRKNSGYVWIESTGRLQIEPGKGRKSVVFSGRIRRMPMLQWSRVAGEVGLGYPDCWSHISIDGGLFLVVSSGAHDVLGRPAQEVIGTKVKDWVGPEYHASVDQTLSEARSGIKGSSPKPLTCMRAARDNVPPQALVIAFYPSEADTSPNPTGRELRPSTIFCHIRFPTVPVLSISYQPPLHQYPPQPLPFSPSVQGFLRPSFSSPGSSSGMPSQVDIPGPADRLVHALNANMFEELETTRGTSWQFELQQLRLTNSNIQHEIDTIIASQNQNPGPSPGVGL